MEIGAGHAGFWRRSPESCRTRFPQMSVPGHGPVNGVRQVAFEAPGCFFFRFPGCPSAFVAGLAGRVGADLRECGNVEMAWLSWRSPVRDNRCLTVSPEE